MMQIVWPRLSTAPTLTGTDVHVWAVPLRVADERLAELRALLSPDEMAKADRIVVPGKREQSIVARGALRSLLAEYTGIAAADLRFEYEEKGRPFLPDSSLSTSFNVTHSGDLALIAVTREGVIGVDVEQIDPTVELLAIGKRFFSANEHAQLSSCSEADRSLAFFRCWTRKESYLKARGTGLYTPLDQFEVTLLDGDPPRLLETRFDPGDAARWTLTELNPAPGYPGALCADRGERRIAGFVWAG
jgi:4'-phosphopantetheinyl transferase